VGYYVYLCLAKEAIPSSGRSLFYVGYDHLLYLVVVRGTSLEAEVLVVQDKRGCADPVVPQGGRSIPLSSIQLVAVSKMGALVHSPYVVQIHSFS
jgi:hypothetical protein